MTLSLNGDGDDLIELQGLGKVSFGKDNASGEIHVACKVLLGDCRVLFRALVKRL